MRFWSSKSVGSHNAKSKGVLVEANRVTMSELHEIWQVEGKRQFDPDS